MSAPAWRGVKHLGYRALSLARGAGAATEGLRALAYHSVGGVLPEDPYGTSISADRFTAHMEAVAAARERFRPATFGPGSPGRLEVAITFDDGYKDTLTTAAPILVRLKLPFTVFVAPGLIRSGSKLYLTRAELKKLAGTPGCSVGAHGDEHVALTGLDDAKLAKALSASRAWLEDAVGKPVNRMSYPYGEVDRRVRDAAQKAGFELAGTSVYGLNPPTCDSLLLKRTEITTWDTVGDLKLKLDGSWDWFAQRQGDPSK